MGEPKADFDETGLAVCISLRPRGVNSKVCGSLLYSELVGTG
jgi:hypothetical protein